MDDKLKFHRMTRPVKFRLIKRFFQSIGHSYEVGVEKSKYLFNYLLYKLNILKRYTNNTHETIWRPTINGQLVEVYKSPIKTEHFTGVLKSTLIDELESDVDYFYYIDRKGLKHVTYTVSNWERHLYKVQTSLVKPGLVIDGKEYVYGDTPKIVRSFKYPDVLPEPFKEMDNAWDRLKMPEPEVIQYDLTKLLNLRYEIVLGYSAELDVTYATVQHALFEARNEFQKYLDTLTLKDIEV